MTNKALNHRTIPRGVLTLLTLGLLLPMTCLAALPPVILIQPTNQSASIGGSVTFDVSVYSLSSVTYQWRKNGTNISGATSQTYSIANVQSSSFANYSVRISNIGGTVTSSNAALTILNKAPVASNDFYTVAESSTLFVGPPTNNLGNWWKFDAGGTNQTVLDSGSNGNNGTRGSSSGTDSADPAWTNGFVGPGALSFDGAADYVSTSSTIAKTSNSFTLSVWFKAATTVGQHHLLWEGVSGGNGYGDPTTPSASSCEMHLSIGNWNQDNKIIFFLGYDVPENGANPISIVSASDFTNTTQWHHAAVTVTNLGGGNFSASLYVDGQLEGTDTGVQNDRSQWGSLLIGKPGASTRYFQGQMDEVRIYKTALSGAQIQGIVRNGILQNDSDPEGDALKVNTNSITGPSNGVLVMNTNGLFTYTPNANFFGTDSFTYRANDGSSNSAPATVTITVIGANRAPVAYGQSISTPDSTAKSITLTGSDTNNDTITFTLGVLPAHGAISAFNTNNGTLTYTPNAGYIGTDSFTFRAHDGLTSSVPATVSINVTPVAPSITAQPQGQSLTAGAQASFSVAASGSAPFTYYWRCNGKSLACSNSPTLTLNGVQSANAGDYSCLVSNAAGAVPSQVVTLAVSTPAPVVSMDSNSGMKPEGFKFGFSITAGATYVVMASTDMKNWTPISTNLAAGSVVTFTDPEAANHPNRFYRVAVQ
jgi:VCBS repeat-containing protein